MKAVYFGMKAEGSPPFLVTSVPILIKLRSWLLNNKLQRLNSDLSLANATFTVHLEVCTRLMMWFLFNLPCVDTK